MPTVKDYASKKKKARRRPGREETHEEIHEDTQEESHEELVEMAEEIVDETEETVRNAHEASEHAEEAAHTADETIDETSGFDEMNRKKIHIEFPYSELVRAKVPKAFEVAENVAEEWVNDGNFENIPVGHPLAQITVAAGLRKAKEVEKKLEEKGVFAMAKMGIEYAKMKINKK
ncbi:MAG: hypothetical protein JSU04_10690 [Bdellovibrionales bacterium]|nr:hypothetical protein [Bdellovibrionales bacterium]